MSWLTWRQFRTQAVVTAGVLAALAIYLVYLGLSSRHAYDTDIVGCKPADCALAARTFVGAYNDAFTLIGAALVGVPAIIGAFWGAPLVTRELEEKTDRLVWNQSVTRTRWLATKLGLLGLATALTAGLFSALLTWSASRFDQVQGNRFAALNFAARNVVPVGYALFALVLGVVTGMVVRRTLPAMAITLALFVVVQVVIPIAVRQHLMSPVTSVVTIEATTFHRIDGIRIGRDGASIMGYTQPGVWELTSSDALFKADGSRYLEVDARSCMAGGPEGGGACMAGQHLHFSHTYQPADRYWPFQWIELAGFLGLALLLSGLGFWWIRHRLN
jgi:ABC-type transport system involved in multi-copper enzyme maturation permease subunit